MDCASTGIHQGRIARWRLWQAVAALFFLLSFWGVRAAAPTAPVAVLQLRGAIGPASADYLVGGLRKAADGGAPLVVIELDTPGGLDTSMRQVIQAILASPVPVAVYVSPEGARAASAGTYILYAAHIAAMAPATTLGAATPVALGLPGGERKPKEDESSRAASKAASAASAPGTPADAMTAKQVHDAAAFIRGLAQLRGRNAEWAERAVREAVSLTAAEALQSKVIDVVAQDLPDLLARIDGRTVHLQAGDRKLATRNAVFVVRPPDWRQEALAVITHPSVALIMMMMGIYGLLIEFMAPGHGVAGVTGAIFLLLALFALQLLPVNYAALGLIVLGIALLVGGVVAIGAGGLLLYDGDSPALRVPLPLVLALALASAAVVLGGGALALKARRKPVVSGREDLLGASGEVLEVSEGQAWAQVFGERWKIDSAQPLAPGQRVRVLGLRGLTLQVQADTQAHPKERHTS
jgi:membrane-bound serine protease (ClpP class)